VERAPFRSFREPAVPCEQSGSWKAQARAEGQGREYSMRNGPAAAAVVETTAAAGDKKRRENTPGVVLKVAVAMMCSLVSGHRGQAGLGSW